MFFESSTVLWLDTPRHAAGIVDVEVRNPDSQIGTLENGYTYLLEGVDFATIQYPTATVVAAPDETITPLFGRAYEADVTPGEGRGAGLCGQLIIGPHDAADPTTDESDWTAHVLAYNGDIGNDDEYKLEGLTMSTVGDYLWAVRFTLAGDCAGLDGSANWVYGDLDGNLNGFDLGEAGTITITDGILVESLDPASISLLGSAQIDVTGSNLGEGLTVETRPPGGDFASQPFTVAGAESLTLDFADPGETPRTVGFYDLELTRDTDTLLVERAFVAGYVRSPVVDGSIDLTAEDWHAAFRLAEGDRETNWGGHTLDALYVAFDEAGLYLAIEGSIERDGVDDRGNAIVVYLDKDFGSGVGTKVMSSLNDHDADASADAWRIDRAITSNLDASAVEGFGADFAFGTMELAPFDRDDYWSGMTGWRRLDVGNFFWFLFEDAEDGTCTYSASCETNTVACAAGTASTADASGVIETFIPWCAIYDGDVPEGGRQIALFVRVLNKDGVFISNQSLPQEAFFDEDEPWAVNDVLIFDVR